MDQLNSESLAVKVRTAILDGQHAHFMKLGDDNSEYIPMIRRIIESISRMVENETKSKEEASRLSKNLHDYAKKLFVDFWMQLAREAEASGEDIDYQDEMLKAKDTFDEHYGNQVV